MKNSRAAHTQAARRRATARPSSTAATPRIAFIGAGSVVFGKNVIADILAHAALQECELRLMDIDRERLDTATRLAQQINTLLGAGATISSTTDRGRALDGADVVICTINVGGYDATLIDHHLPATFGLRQTIGDTLGVGGVFRALRNVPEVLRLCDDMSKRCPQALLINYANPMAIHCLAIARSKATRVVGLCHGVQNTAHTLRAIVGMKAHGVTPAAVATHFKRRRDSAARVREWLDWMAMGEDPALNYLCAGINHMAFFLRFRSGQRDLYPEVHEILAMPHLRRLDPVRFGLYECFGYFMTETSGHIAEYLPYYLRSATEIARMELRPGSYLQTCRAQDADYHHLRRDLLAGRPLLELPYRLSVEHASRIINALVTGVPYVFNGNVYNAGGRLIDNLPADACVELPCTADYNGITPHRVGRLPPACAALITTNINVQDLTVRGILEGNRDYIRQALLLDPNTAATLTPTRIRQLADAMFKAHQIL